VHHRFFLDSGSRCMPTVCRAEACHSSCMVLARAGLWATYKPKATGEVSGKHTLTTGHYLTSSSTTNKNLCCLHAGGRGPRAQGGSRKTVANNHVPGKRAERRWRQAQQRRQEQEQQQPQQAEAEHQAEGEDDFGIGFTY